MVKLNHFLVMTIRAEPATTTAESKREIRADNQGN